MSERHDMVPDMGEHLKTFDDNMLVTQVVAMFGLCPKVGALLLPMAACFWKGASRQDNELRAQGFRRQWPEVTISVASMAIPKSC